MIQITNKAILWFVRTVQCSAVVVCFFHPILAADHDGFIRSSQGNTVFPIGIYENPQSAQAIQDMAKAGINLIRCDNREHLDAAAQAGLVGWMPLSLHSGPTDALKKKVESVKDHPALAVWEGPDEIVWNFTAFSGLERTAGIKRVDWQSQTPKAVGYAREQGNIIMPNIRKAIELVRGLDPKDRPVWINEAAESDVAYVREYMDHIDITGADYYPIKSDYQNMRSIGRLTDRWRRTGRGKPVWMVLQAFSWHSIRTDRGIRYPTFYESRMNAYDAIVHGAKGIIYWGSFYIDDPDFRQSLYALTSELHALQPFLVRPDEPGLVVDLIEAPLDERKVWGVRASAKRLSDAGLIILVNEDNHRHQAVELTGLDWLNGRRLQLLYGDEDILIQRGELLTRMQAFEVKVFATALNWEADWRDGREFGGRPIITRLFP